MIIATIRKGYKFLLEDAEYEVIGSQSFRGKYNYIVLNLNKGVKQSLSRDNMLQWQKDGLLKFEV